MSLDVIATYVHDLSPFLIRFSEQWGLRWYGLSYVLAFLAAILILQWLGRRGKASIPVSKASDFVTWCALIGVFVGGRLGYMLFYDLERFLGDPLIFFKVLGGGMSSHGGIIGVAIFCWFFARRHRLTWTGVGDDVVTVAPLGIGFGRLANFINGELYGRATDVAWGMKFPLEGVGDGKLRGVGLEHSPEILDYAESHGFLEEFVASLTVRHPSQLYQAGLEGFLIFAVILGIRLWRKALPDGVLTGIFFIGYAILRIVVERFREPDAELIMGVTRGQFYSGFMILAGVAFLVWAGLRKAPKKVT